MKDYLIVMPAFNEETRIEFVLSRMTSYRDNTIIVDDGSVDSTLNIIKRNKFKYISNKKNYGVAKCILQGMDYALENNIKKIILMDSDGQHDPKFIANFLESLMKHEYAFGCRFHQSEFIPTCKWGSNLFATALYAELSGKLFTDVSCGFKGLTISKDLVKFLEDSQRYEIIYDIVNYALMSNSYIDTICIQAVYSYDTLLYTKTNEIISLLNSIERYMKICKRKDLCNVEQIIKMMRRSIKYHERFHANILNINFWAFPICEEGFLFQINPKDILIWNQKASLIFKENK